MRPAIDRLLISIEVEPLAQIGIFSAKFFGKKLAQSLIFFFQLQEIFHLIDRRHRRG
ncbi:hypothetical protein Rleg9DRAFT_4900 [Rhizobium leguminosarum bv. trifolii WSM597]|uniref:Uncharacterized protein n=1 Tax=Rhizobium leguminosarum bv. trifolii WSM597 TaxID=754764 RepID=J0H722_RHILT|nr:hypothetical protein Rleg9DRAFT_4900 [Rhizobium leguminosarum bv. trifolii WSM597]